MVDVVLCYELFLFRGPREASRTEIPIFRGFLSGRLPGPSKPCPSFPWCFCFLGVFLAGDFLGVFECFLLISQFLKGSQGEENPCCVRGFP